MPEFFLELFSEEIPARMQKDAARALQDRCLQVFFFLNPESPKVFYSPRRIALSVTINADDSVGKTDTAEARGPREGAPAQAVDGFLKKYDGDRSDLIVENGYYILRRKLAPTSARDIILNDLAKSLTRLPWPKSMRWGQSGDFTWVRPLRRMICLLDGEIIPIKLGPITASNMTEGHRFMAPGEFAVNSAADWEAKLAERYVIANANERATKIGVGQNDVLKTLSLNYVPDIYLSEEVAGLVEWPVTLFGKIDQQFMDLPHEVRELSMRTNQRYFALRDNAGRPAPYFMFVANIEASDGGKSIIAGNERVLRARLSDARHFWELDLKTSLDKLLPKLENITFHAKIGTQRQRADRIASLAERIADALNAHGWESIQARQAGLLSKADLVTGMVGEFPELQGIMGGYYAGRMVQGWDGNVVGPAIRTHYQPKGPNDEVPKGLIPASVALADKLDTLVQFFRIGEKPTGSGDPYALRRSALGVIRIILENDLRLPLKPYLDGNPDLLDFILERLRVLLRSNGKRYDVVSAVLAVGEDDDLLRVIEKAKAVENMISEDYGIRLLAAYRRAVNILRIEENKDNFYYEGTIDLPLLKLDEEKRLSEALGFIGGINAVGPDGISHGLLGLEQFGSVLRGFSSLREPVDAFFDKVTVNAPEPELRRNRLQLLARLRDLMHQIADFSKIEG